jgi:DNA-binding NarL/FixJ family response regulator
MIKLAVLDKHHSIFNIAKSHAVLNEVQRRLNDELEVTSYDLNTGLGSCPANRPDIMLLDVEACRPKIVAKAKLAYPAANLIAVGEQCEIAIVNECFRKGAVGYLHKKTLEDDLTYAIVLTQKGESFISPSICRLIINNLQESKSVEDMLTARELQISRGIIEGLSYKMVAARHNIALDTVRVYIKRIYRKLNINSKLELANNLKYI